MTLNNINSISVCFFLGAKRRSNPFLPLRGEMDCFASLAMTSKRTFTASPRNAPEPPPVGQIINPRRENSRMRQTRGAFALWTRTCCNVQTRLAQRSYPDDYYRFPGSCLRGEHSEATLAQCAELARSR